MILGSENTGPGIGLIGNWADNCIIRADGDQDNASFQGSLTHVTDTGQMSLGQVAAPCSLLELWDDDAHPILSITAAHANLYDPQIQFRTDVTDTVKCSMGIDSGDSDKFKIYLGDGIGGTTEFVIDTNGGIKCQNTADSTTAYQWLDADGGTPILNIDSHNERVGIGTDAPSHSLHIVNASGAVIKVQGNSVNGFGAIENYNDTITRFGHYRITGPSSLDFDAIPLDGTSGCLFRFFRNVNTTGDVRFNVYRGDGSTSVNNSMGGNTDTLFNLLVGNLGIGEPNPETKVEMTSTAPYWTSHNSTEENIEGGRECIWRAKGEKQDGTEHTLGQFQFSHDGTGDDYKADFILSLNQNGGADTLVEALRIDSAGLMTYTGTSVFQNSADSTTAYQWLDADDDTPIMNIDSTNERVGIKTAAPGYDLDIIGNTAMDALYFYENADHGTPNIKKAYSLTSAEGLRIDIGSGAPNYFTVYDNSATVNAVFKIQQQASGIGGNILLRPDGNIGIGEPAPETLVEMTSTVPYFTFHNNTEEDIAGGRESIQIFKGETQAGFEHVLGKMTVAHDGAGADQKGYWSLALNASADGDSPTERMRMLANGNLGINEVAPQDTFELNGTMLIKDALKFTQDDGNENIDSLADGYMDYTATTGHRFNTLIEASGDVVFTGAGSGLPYGCISGLAETVTCTDQSTYYQVTFDTAGPSNLTTISIANEEITVLKTGIYVIAVTACFHSGVSHDFELLVKKNDGATPLEPHLFQTTAVANQVENTAGSCIVSLTANDRIELFVRCTDAAGQDAIFDHVSLTCAMVGG